MATLPCAVADASAGFAAAPTEQRCRGQSRTAAVARPQRRQWRCYRRWWPDPLRDRGGQINGRICVVEEHGVLPHASTATVLRQAAVDMDAAVEAAAAECEQEPAEPSARGQPVRLSGHDAAKGKPRFGSSTGRTAASAARAVAIAAGSLFHFSAVRSLVRPSDSYGCVLYSS